MKTKPLLISLVFISVALVASRLLPHAAHWTPALALLVLAGFLARKNPLGFLLPALAWLVTDLYLGFYNTMLFNYAALLGCALVGMALYKTSRPANKTWQTSVAFAGSGAVAASLFFLISNFGVWFTQAPQCQPATLGGLATCYELGLPFYRASLVSTTAWMLGMSMVYQVLRQPLQQWWVEEA